MSSIDASDDVLYVKIGARLKDKLSSLAMQHGFTLTQYVALQLESCVKRDKARGPELRLTMRNMSEGIFPGALSRLIMTAKGGGSQGYRKVGQRMATYTARTVVFRYCKPEMIMTWYDRMFPLVMKRIPRRRRPQFLLGIVDVWNEVFKAGWHVSPNPTSLMERGLAQFLAGKPIKLN